MCQHVVENPDMRKHFQPGMMRSSPPGGQLYKFSEHTLKMYTGSCCVCVLVDPFNTNHKCVRW